jgi:hypothetical protein
VLRRGDFVVVLFHLGAHFRHRCQHFAAHVLRRVLRRDGEVALLDADAVAEIAALVVGIAVGRQFDRVDLETRIVRIGLEAHVVEHEEFGFRSEEDRVAEAHRAHQRFGLFRHAARIAVIGLAGRRLEHVADQNEGRLGKERIDARAGRIGHQIHIGLIDRLPAGDGRAVEHLAFRKGVFFDDADVEGHVLPLAARIGEAEIDVFDVVILDHFHDIFGCRHGLTSPSL